MTVKGIFFDMDGVVVDSDPLWNTNIRTVREEYALDMSCLERSDGYNLSTGEAIRLVLEDMGRYSDALLEEILHRIDILYSLHLDMVSLMPGMAETLEMLHERRVHTALVSNSSRRQVDMLLDSLCLRKYFQTVVTADDVTCGKPDAEPYLRAMELTGLTAADAVAVEDSPTGIAAAVNAGLRCLVPVPADFKSCGTKDHDGICYVRRENLYGKLDNLLKREFDEKNGVNFRELPL